MQTDALLVHHLAAVSTAPSPGNPHHDPDGCHVFGHLLRAGHFVMPYHMLSLVIQLSSIMGAWMNGKRDGRYRDVNPSLSDSKPRAFNH